MDCHETHMALYAEHFCAPLDAVANRSIKHATQLHVAARQRSRHEVFKAEIESILRRHVRHDTQPTFVFYAGSPGSGKSSVLPKLPQDAVYVSADHFKRLDPLFLDESASKQVHDASVAAAEQLLAICVSTRRNVVFDSTAMWSPFIVATIRMLRDNRHTYEARIGPKSDLPNEVYWVRKERTRTPLPSYKVKMWAVYCDVDVAFARALLRQFLDGRKIPVAVLRRSHKLLRENFELYAALVDEAVLYDNSEHMACPAVVARKAAGGALRVERAALWAQFRGEWTRVKPRC